MDVAYTGPQFCEPWRYEVCVERDFKWVPLDHMDSEAAARAKKSFTDVNAILWCSPAAEKHPNSGGEIIGFTALRDKQLAAKRAKRIVECVNAMAGIPSPPEFLKQLRTMVDLLVQGEFPDQLITQIDLLLNQGLNSQK